MPLVSENIGERDDVARGGAPRALIVSEVRLYREALAWRLEQSGRVIVVGTAERGDVALRLATEHAAEVVIIDRAMTDALSFARAIGDATRAKVVAFAIADVDHAVIEVAEAGLAGYVTRDGTVDDLVETVERAVRGELLCSPRMAATLFRRLATLSSVSTPTSVPAAPSTSQTSRQSELTHREREIAELIERGLSNKEIARELAIGTATVKNHVHNILEKLDVSRRGEAAATMRDERAGRRIDCV
jgi:two-component system nitrate/nitrite response regulator NarL